jgi:hypothetical protein
VSNKDIFLSECDGSGSLTFFLSVLMTIFVAPLMQFDFFTHMLVGFIIAIFVATLLGVISIVLLVCPVKSYFSKNTYKDHYEN